MYRLTAKTLVGDDTRSYEQEEDAIEGFKKFNKVYKNVTLIKVVTTVVETVVRDSSKPEG